MHPPTLDGWCYVHFHPTFYLVLLSFSLASFQLFHPAHGLFGFILCYFLSRAYTFSIMFSQHFFSKFLHPEFGSQCCKYTLTEPPAPKMHVHTPGTANAFWGHNIEDWRLKKHDAWFREDVVFFGILIIIIMAGMAVFYVAGYLIEERRRWPVITASPRGQCSK